VRALDKETSRSRARMSNRFVPSSMGSFSSSSIDLNDPSNLLNGSDREGLRPALSLEDVGRDIARRREGRGANAAPFGSGSAFSSVGESAATGYSAVESAFDYQEMPMPNVRSKSIHGDI
jgi:hypothetical protein